MPYISSSFQGNGSEIDSFFMVKQTNHDDLNRGDCALHEIEKNIVEAECRPPCAGYNCAGI